MGSGRSQLEIVITGRDAGGEATLRRVIELAGQAQSSVKGVGEAGNSADFSGVLNGILGLATTAETAFGSVGGGVR
jgi:hypothetical protein